MTRSMILATCDVTIHSKYKIVRNTVKSEIAQLSR